jgi:hypothetical protein
MRALLADNNTRLVLWIKIEALVISTNEYTPAPIVYTTLTNLPSTSGADEIVKVCVTVSELNTTNKSLPEDKKALPFVISAEVKTLSNTVGGTIPDDSRVKAGLLGIIVCDIQLSSFMLRHLSLQ